MESDVPLNKKTLQFLKAQITKGPQISNKTESLNLLIFSLMLLNCLTNMTPFALIRITFGQPRWPSGLVPPLAQGLILETWDQVPRAPCVKPASPSACVSAFLSLSLSLSLMNK